MRRLSPILPGLDLAAFALAPVLPVMLSRFGSAGGIEGQNCAFAFLYAILAVAGLIRFAAKGHYDFGASWWQQVGHVITFCLFALLLQGFANYILGSSPVCRWASLAWLIAVPALLSFRWIGRAILIRAGRWNIPVILVGGWKNAAETVYALKSETWVKYDLKYAVVSGENGGASFNGIHPDIPVRQDLEEIAPEDFIIFCPEHNTQIPTAQHMAQIGAANARYAIVPPSGEFSYTGLQPQSFFGYDTVLLEPRRTLQTVIGRLAKQVMDRLGALIALILLSPLFLVIAWKVRKDGGPAFYGHKRLGRNGKTFKCWKFRSMNINSEAMLKELLANDPEARAEWDRDFKLKNDPRITKIGHFIRKTSLDEIPQLFNVLKGEMSLVGPRPIVEDEKKYYGDKIHDYFSVNPGITGLWQVSGRNDVTYAQRVYLDSWYVHHWSIWNDMIIMIKTVLVIAFRKGAY
jgi:undecaprenyl-phosphate galactose phosphotransferase